MLLESQNQFIEDYLKPLSRGEVRELPAGYKDMYAKWQTAYPGLTHLSPHEQAVSFADFLDTEVKKIETSLVPGDTLVDQKNKKLISQGKVVLASTDGGKTFNKLVKPEDLATTKGENLQFLSPTLRTSTTDVHELMNEQVLLHAANNLTSQNYLVQKGFIQNNTIHLEVKTPRLVDYNVLIDTTQKFDKPMNYVFVNKEGTAKNIPETQLAEKYGQPEIDPTLRPMSHEELGAAMIGMHDSKQKQVMMGAGVSSLNNSNGLDHEGAHKESQALKAFDAAKAASLINLANFAGAASNAQQQSASGAQHVRDAKQRFENSKKNNEKKPQDEQKQKDGSQNWGQQNTAQLNTQNKKQSGYSPETKQAAGVGIGIGTAVAASVAATVGLTTAAATILT